MRTTAPAKINWTLEVLGRRSDGYHEVRTVLQAIDLLDELYVEPAESLSVHGSPATPEDEIIVRAVRALAEFAGREPWASIRVEKRLPAGAGLGGGSSDAAATLRTLNRMWRLELDNERLAQIAARCGSDVPFFVSGGTALGQGRGDQVTSLPDVPPMWLVLLVPPKTIDDKTQRMYASLTKREYSDGSRTDRLAAALRRGKRPEDKMLSNAFESVAYRVFAELSHYHHALLSAGARAVHLAGSGPALFAVAAGEREAIEMRERLGETGGQAYAVRTLTARESTVIVDE